VRTTEDSTLLVLLIAVKPNSTDKVHTNTDGVPPAAPCPSSAASTVWRFVISDQRLDSTVLKPAVGAIRSKLDALAATI